MAFTSMWPVFRKRRSVKRRDLGLSLLPKKDIPAMAEHPVHGHHLTAESQGELAPLPFLVLERYLILAGLGFG